MTVQTIKRSSPDRRLYGYASAIAALIMVVGFAKTYYLRAVFNSPSISTLFQIHGAVMTLWFVVFIAQVRLVARKRIDLHRRLGWIAAGLSVLVVALGSAVAIDSARRGFTPGEFPPLVFLMIPLAILFIFAVLIGLALYFRRRGDIHKRLMLLASLNMLTPGIARLPIPGFAAVGPKLYIGLTLFLVLVCVAYDTIQNRKLHPAFGWGAGLLILSFPLRILIANTSTWLRLATWLTG